MEISEWAELILSANSMEGKLFSPNTLTDTEPGLPKIWDEPVRPPGMSFNRRSKEEKLPKFHEHEDPEKRAICLHRFAGHELLAVEIMAYTLLAFPDAPKHFRRGVANTLKEEQQHVRLYMKRMEEMGLRFGDLPLYKHFWKHTPYLLTPMHYISVMSLTFEMANLDFATLYGKSFARIGDKESTELMATILKDEINHVGFGWHWLQKLKEKEASEWDSWEATLATTLIDPKRAKGLLLHEEPRVEAGIHQEWIAKLKTLH